MAQALLNLPQIVFSMPVTLQCPLATILKAIQVSACINLIFHIETSVDQTVAFSAILIYEEDILNMLCLMLLLHISGKTDGVCMCVCESVCRDVCPREMCPERVSDTSDFHVI